MIKCNRGSPKLKEKKSEVHKQRQSTPDNEVYHTKCSNPLREVIDMRFYDWRLVITSPPRGIVRF